MQATEKPVLPNGYKPDVGFESRSTTLQRPLVSDQPGLSKLLKGDYIGDYAGEHCRAY